MSLLNQVLQDLEKRQTESPETTQDSSVLKLVKATEQQQTKNYFLIASLLLLALFSAYLVLTHKPDPKTLTKKLAIPALIKPVIKNITPKKIITTHLEVTKKTPVLKKQVPVIQPKQVTKKTSKKITPIIATQHKADYFFSKAKKSSHLLEQQNLLNKTLALETKHLAAHLLLANNLLQQGLNASAITALQNSLNVLPGNIALSNILAQLYLQTKQVNLNASKLSVTY